MPDLFQFADDLGPAKIIHVHEPTIGLKAVLVVDNVARGPSIGGLRMAPDVSVEECFRLARAMTMKNAAAGLAHGGGKSVLWGDPHMQPERKESLVRTFALTDRTRLQFRAEAFNVTNQVNLGLPVGDLNSANFGRILAAGPARLIQFGLKLTF